MNQPDTRRHARYSGNTAYLRRPSRQSELGFSTIALAILVTSYFYVLPLGRYSLAGIASDFRLYDFVFIIFFFGVGLKHLPKLQSLFRTRSGFFYWAIWLLILVWFSLSITLAFSGLSKFLPAVIRAFRFTTFILTAGYVRVLVDTPHRFRFLLVVLYLNIMLQAILAFAQGVGLLPNFWPSYWVNNYGDVPVGTLSPHHKQIGVVMLLGMAMTGVFIHNYHNVFVRALLVVVMAFMVTVPVFSGVRTTWLAFIPLTLAYLYIYRGRGLMTVFILTIGVGFLIWLNQDWVREPLEAQINARFVDLVNEQGLEGVYGERTVIYFNNLPQGIQNRPWVLLIGTGFQNVGLSLLGATGAHNNYLQAWLELGILGFIVYMQFLYWIFKELRKTSSLVPPSLEKNVAYGSMIAFVAVLATMLVGESLWAQYSMFTLTGQIMVFMALGISPINWIPKTSEEETTHAADLPLRSYSRRFSTRARHSSFPHRRNSPEWLNKKPGQGSPLV